MSGWATRRARLSCSARKRCCSAMAASASWSRSGSRRSVSRSLSCAVLPGPNSLGPDEWREHLGAFDWVILAVPSTPETEAMIGAVELAAMKPSAVLLNVSRGEVIDQDALVAALTAKQIAAAFLDVTTPEPLPRGSPSVEPRQRPHHHAPVGPFAGKMFIRSAARFLENLERYRKGEPLSPSLTSIWDIDHAKPR